MVLIETSFYPWVQTQWINGHEVCVNGEGHDDYNGILRGPPKCPADDATPQVDPRRSYLGCPAGWYDYDTKSGECRPPPSYRGTCSRILASEYDGMDAMRETADRCRVLWPFIHDPPAAPVEEQDFTQPCPAGWKHIKAKSGDIHCLAPETYFGRSKNLQNFTGFGPEEKVAISSLIGAPWPLKAIPTNFDFNRPCPEGWDYLQATKTCKAPPPPVYVPTEDCPGEVESFGTPEKVDSFPNPTTPFDRIDGISNSTLRKLEFMRKCHVDWPAVDPAHLRGELKPVVFSVKDADGTSQQYTCPAGYHRASAAFAPTCVQNDNVTSRCESLIAAVKVADSKEFLAKYDGCVSQA